MGPSAYDVIVVGGGAIGLSAAYHCARAGKKVLLLEQFEFFNERASSKGDSRFFRIIYADVRLSLLAQSAYSLWRELEREAEATLLTLTGILFYGIAGDLMTREGNLRSCLQVMDALGIPYQNYDASALKERFPVLKNIPPQALGLFQEQAGVIHAHATLRALHHLAQQRGANLRAGEPVERIHPDPTTGVVEVETTVGRYRANKLILAPGAWANALLGHLSLQLALETWQVTYAYYRVEDTRCEYPMWFFFGEPRNADKNLYYGLPPVTTPGRIKAGADFTERVEASPAGCDFSPDPKLLELTGNFLRQSFAQVDPEPLDPQACIYTMTPDHNFVLDQIPGHDNIVLFTGGTGQAFKYTPLLGKILSQLALAGKTEYNIADFSIHRPGILASTKRAL